MLKQKIIYFTGSLKGKMAALLPAWFIQGLLWPFLVTRLAWVICAYYASPNYQPNPTYQEYHSRGWFLSKYFLLDIFARWDGRHYLSIARDGYQLSGALGEHMDNLAFFPLYPYLVKGISWLAYGWTSSKIPDSLLLLVGIILSNLLFLAGAAAVYRLAVDHLGFEPASVKRAAGLMMVFPVNFLFSSFYSESLFFFLAAAGFLAAYRRSWMWAGVCAGLLTITRPQGPLVALALGLFYLQVHQWKLRAVRLDVLWFGLPPLLLLAHFYNLYRLTGSFFAPVVAQTAWGRSQYGFFEGMRLQLEAPYLDIFKLDALFAVLFMACGVYILLKTPHKMLGVYSLLMVILPISTGMLISAQRFTLVVFPVFLLLGDRIRSPRVYDAVRAVCFALQVLYWIGWVNYYWIA